MVFGRPARGAVALEPHVRPADTCVLGVPALPPAMG